MSVITNILAISTDGLQPGFRFARAWGGASGPSTPELPLTAGTVSFRWARRKWLLWLVPWVLGV